MAHAIQTNNDRKAAARALLWGAALAVAIIVGIAALPLERFAPM